MGKAAIRNDSPRLSPTGVNNCANMDSPQPGACIPGMVKLTYQWVPGQEKEPK